MCVIILSENHLIWKAKYLCDAFVLQEFEVQNILNLGEKVIVCYLLLIVEYPLAFKMLSLLRRLQHLKKFVLESYIFLIKYLKHMLLYISGSELFFKKNHLLEWILLVYVSGLALQTELKQGIMNRMCGFKIQWIIHIC